MQNKNFILYIIKCFVNECYLLFVPGGQTFFTCKRGRTDQTFLDLKGLSTLKLTCSGSKDQGLLILTLTLIFDFGETPKNGRVSEQKCQMPSANPFSSGRQIPALPFTIPRLQGFVKRSTGNCCRS